MRGDLTKSSCVFLLGRKNSELASYFLTMKPCKLIAELTYLRRWKLVISPIIFPMLDMWLWGI